MNAVAREKDDEVYFTLERAAVVENVLVANNTYAYFAMNYGKDTGPTPIANPNIPSAPKGICQTYAPGVERALNLNNDYFKWIINGFLNNQPTGTVECYLCCRKGADPANPTFEDMYLDIVVSADGSIEVVDRDELDEALQSGAITVLQHGEAIEACEKLEKFLRENSTAVLDWCSAMQRKLKREMPV